MNKEEESSVKKDLWLSKILEKPCFNLICKKKCNPNNFLKKLPKNNYFISSKVNSYDVENIITLQKIGFKIVDFSYSLKRNYVLNDFPKNENFVIKEACTDNKKEVAEIAKKAFKHSRFHKDPLISKDKADIIKKEWAKNFFSGQRGDLMLVASIKNNLSKDFKTFPKMRSIFQSVRNIFPLNRSNIVNINFTKHSFGSEVVFSGNG